MSAVIHAVIYGAVFKLMRQMTTGEAIVVAVVVIGALFMWAKIARQAGMVINSRPRFAVANRNDLRFNPEKKLEGYKMAVQNLRTRLIGGLAVVIGMSATQAHADGFTYNGFASTAGLNLVGNAGTAATSDGTVLRIIPAAGSTAGAAYSTSPVTLGSGDTFSTSFNFRFTSAGGVDPADGITFVLAASPTGLGTSGYGMGYQGVGNSVAIEFDTYNNGLAGQSLGYFPQEPNSSNHVAIDTDGVLTNTAATNVYGNGSCGFVNGAPAQNSNLVAGCMSNGDLWTVNISYNGTALNVSLSDPAESTSFAALTNYALDVSSLLGTNIAYVGFTGSSGAGYENEDITTWQFANTATLPPSNSVPEPHEFVAAGFGSIARRICWGASPKLKGWAVLKLNACLMTSSPFPAKIGCCRRGANSPAAGGDGS